ncbi:hypothetical protein [Rheinheimera sp. NSM]|uniref:hypothetical protein n=1 Tax=Rheinheimera sp. NSM TaxID=3457884 RepID=UPI0040354B44
MKKYLLLLLLVTLAGIAAVSAFSYLIDPYGIYRHSADNPLFGRKVAAADKGRTIKPYQAMQLNPATLLVGNSRVEIGLPVQHAFYQDAAVYNLGLPGAGIAMQYDYAWHVLRSRGSVKQVVIALDFLDFTSSRHNISTQPDRSQWQSRLRYHLGSPDIAQQHHAFLLKERLSLLFSATALGDTLYTAFAQTQQTNALNTAGFNDGGVYYQQVATEGFSALYRQKSAELAQRLAAQPLFVSTQSHHFNTLDTFIRLLKAEQTDIYLLINPYQQPYLEQLTAHQLNAELAIWKQHLQQLAKQHQLALYDFAIASPPVMNVVDLASKTASDSPYFWEPSHYRPALGSLMLDVLHSGQCRQQYLLCDKYSD